MGTERAGGFGGHSKAEKVSPEKQKGQAVKDSAGKAIILSCCNGQGVEGGRERLLTRGGVFTDYRPT